MIPFSFFGIWVLTKARCLDAQTVRSLADAICRIEKDQTCMDDLARARHFACHGQIYRGAGGLRRGGRPGRARPRRSDDRILGGAPDGPLSRASHHSPRGRRLRDGDRRRRDRGRLSGHAQERRRRAQLAPPLPAGAGGDHPHREERVKDMYHSEPDF